MIKKIKKCLSVCKKCQHYNGEMDFSPEMMSEHKLLPMCAIHINDYTYLRDLYEKMNAADRRMIFITLYGEQNYIRRQTQLMKMVIHSESKIFIDVNKKMLKEISKYNGTYKASLKRRKLIPDKYCSSIPDKMCPYNMEHLIINQPLIN